MGTLQDQLAVVTGASSGIGQAIALALARQGARLVLVGRNLATLQQVAGATGLPASHVACRTADLARPGDVAALVAVLQRECGPIGAVVHGAGVMAWGPMAAATAEQLDSTYRTNVQAPYLLTQGLLPQLQAGQGQVVFLNSSAGLAARANVAQYAASKHALKAVADALREEVNAAGIRVLSLYLGRTASAMQAAIHAAEGRPYRPELLLQPDEVADVVVHALSTPRGMEITDIHLRPMLKSY